MLVSVIIPTYNRANQISNILDALEEQTFKNFNVVIVNDGSVDNTKEVLETIKNNYSFPIKPVHSENGGRANARNLGAKNADGDILLFYDDDVRPNPNSINCHYNFHTKLATEPSILDGPALYDLDKIEDDFFTWRVSVEHSWYKKDPKPIKKTNCTLTGANKSMLKKTWEQLGGMTAGLSDAEDYELGFRAMHDHDIPIYTCYDNWVYHDDFKTFKEFLHRRYIGMGAAKKLYTDNPRILEIYPYRWIFSPKFPKSLIFKLFRTKLMVNFIDSKAFSFLPQKIRYKFYDVVVMAANIYCKQY